MKKLYFLILVFIFSISVISCAEDKNLLIDDFEAVISGGEDGTVDFGAGNGSSVEVSAAADIKNSGKQSLKVSFNSVSGGYMWIARGFGLDAKNANWLVKPEDINWKDFSAFSFYVFGNDSKVKVAFDIKDNGNEMWRFMFTDDFKVWKKIAPAFSEFFVRGDWQPESADKNAALDFPLKSFQFEP